jgi:chemotaxis response regulator CheB
MDVDLSTPRTARVPEPEVGIDVSHLELAPLDDGTVVEPVDAPNVAAPAQPAAVEPPVSSQSRMAIEGAAPVHGGLIAIVAGLGGPDAVRQFLGALPTTLPVPVLLWQHLDAGKHDRLAQQLSKASKLPVYLAQPGELARPGAVGVMGTGMAVISDSGWWIEAGSASASQGLAAALKDPTTVVAILSGAEPAIIEPASAHSANGGKVLVQTAATCFDGTAASALERQGATAAAPTELAALAAAGWAS